jgi:molybdopterin molybdotransferase
MPASAELFKVVTPQHALAALMAQWQPAIRTERIATEDALHRVLAERVLSQEDLPAYRRSTVDGYAVTASDTHGASPGLPALLSVIAEAPMGRAVDIPMRAGAAVRVHTGSMLPADADAVVMVEHTQIVLSPVRGGGLGRGIEVMRAVAGGENVLQVGEDAKRGATLYDAGHTLRPQDIGGLMALGITEVSVAARPRVGILSTGDEVIPPAQQPGPGQVRDVNAYALAAQAQQAGALPVRYGIIPDDRAALEAAAQKALAECDIVVISAGSSVSDRDMSVDVINALGRPGVLVHGVSVKPGKPTIIAACDGKAVFGLPGNPASAMVIFDLFVLPAIRACLGQPALRPITARARLTRNISSATGREDYVPVNLEERDGELWAAPVFGKSNLIYTLVRADGRVKIDMDLNGIRAGEEVTVYL